MKSEVNSYMLLIIRKLIVDFLTIIGYSIIGDIKSKNMARNWLSNN